MDSRLKTAAILAASIIIPDQITKALIQRKYALWDTDPVIPGFFNLVHVLNKGAAFRNPNAAPLFSTADHGDRFFIWGLGLVLGGALGNLVDRIRFGFVVDFLDFFVGQYHWPAFNVADIAITCGAFCVIISMYMKNRREQKSSGQRA